MANRFNLIDEPWIPVADEGRVSLRALFSEAHYSALGGNPVQKIAVMKLLLAIAQAAATPPDEEAWRAMSPADLAERCLAYLEQWYSHFYLYGERPFLQMPAVASAAVQAFGALLPDVSSGNTTVLNQSQVERPLDDASKALLLVTQMAFALAGKKVDNSLVLTSGYAGKRNDKGKPSSGKPGPAVAHMGLLHSFLLGTTLWKTLRFNLLSAKQIEDMRIYPNGLGVAPWECMPTGEDCEVAQKLKHSLMGRLIPLCRFCLLADQGLHFTEGIAHGGYKEGVVDPSVAVDYFGKEPRALWTNPEKRPWRELTALLSVVSQQQSGGFQNWQLQAGLPRVKYVDDTFAVWSAGLRVRSNAGEQFVSGTDDFVESLVWLTRDTVDSLGFSQLKAEMDRLDELAKQLYGCILHYCKELTVDGAAVAAQGTNHFWQLSERDFQSLVRHCDQSEISVAARRRLRRQFSSYAHDAYDRLCPRETARQLDAWVQSRPNHMKYLSQEV
jgi:CRISPR system Cascade subunit CasA